eukprot:m.203864 g.203864  ORF g.203864 m.203864 type:complete len:134 (+) comp18458_c0_seq1:1-402(+)
MTGARARVGGSWSFNLHVCTPQQELLQSVGPGKHILPRLCALPFQYFTDPRLKQILFPTLICVCFEHPANTQQLQSEMNCSLVADFLQGILQQSEDDTSPDLPAPLLLENRFPASKWKAARQYFAAAQPDSDA